MRTYKLKAHGEEYTIALRREHYYDDNLAIDMDYLDKDFGWAPFASLTVNLGRRLPDDMAYVDTNNCPWAEQFIKDNSLGEPTGEYGHSGYCDYPLYKFKEEL